MKISLFYLFCSVESRLNHQRDISIYKSRYSLFAKIKIYIIFLLKFVFIILFDFLFLRNKEQKINVLVYDDLPRYKKLISENFNNKKHLYFFGDIEINDVMRILKIRRYLKFFLTFIIKYSRISPIDLLISKSNSIILFEGDDAWSMVRSYIAILFNAKSIIIQNGAFIFNELSGSQINFICSDFITTSPFIVKRISEFSSEKIKWYIIDNPYLKLNSRTSIPKVYFVGQHAITSYSNKDELSSKIQPLSFHEFKNRICSLFKEIQNLGFEVNYILHPLENIPKDFEPFFNFVLLDQFEFTSNDLIFGYYSSLLLELNIIGLNTFLLGSQYKGLVFEKLLAQNKTAHFFPLNSYKSDFGDITRKVIYFRDNFSLVKRTNYQSISSKTLSIVLGSLLAK